MATTKSRIRKRPLSATADQGFQGVCMDCNHRTDWFKNEDTAQRHVDKHIESEHKSARGAKRSKAEDEPASQTPHAELQEQDADGVPPGGQDTGPRGDSEYNSVPGGQDTGPRGED